MALRFCLLSPAREAGQLAGVASPVQIDSPQFYVHWRLRAGSRISLPAEPKAGELREPELMS